MTSPKTLCSRSALCLAVWVAGVVYAADPPPIRSGSEIEYPPFCVIDAHGRPDGFSVELLKAAIEAMARTVAFRTGAWPEVKGWLDRGEVDALPLVGRTPEREEAFGFTFPYMTLYGAIVVRDGTTDIERIEDLRGRRVAVMQADNAEEFLRREDRGIEIHATPTFERALQELSEGRHDAVVMQRLVALRLIQKMKLGNLRVIAQPIQEFRQDFCFAVRTGDAETLALLNEGLSLVIADGTHRRLHAKWFAALELPSDRRMVVGGDHNFPPYEFLNAEGQPDGFAVELMQAVARQTDIAIDVRLGPWAQMVRALETGEIDAIQGMFYSHDRSLKFDFSLPHALHHYVSVVPTGSARTPKSFAELTGLRLVAQAGDLLHDELMRHGFSNQVSVVETQEDVLRAVIEGRADCGLVMRLSAIDLIGKNNWTNLVLGRKPILTAEYCIAVAKGDSALLAQLNEGLRLLKASGEYRQIQEKWLGTMDAPPTLLALLHRVAWFVGPLLLIVSVILLWSLRRQVSRRTGELRASEAQYRHLIDNVHDIIYTLTPDGVFTFISPSWAHLLGHPIEEVIGKPFQPFVHPNDVDACNTVIRDLMEEKQPRMTVTYRVRHVDGTWRWHASSVTLVKGTSGAAVTVHGVATDITERKTADERIRHLNRVLRAIRDVSQLIVREHNREALIRQGCKLLVDNRGYISALIVLTDASDRTLQWAGAGIAVQSEPLRALLDSGQLLPCCDCSQPNREALAIRARSRLCATCPAAAPCADSLSQCVRLIHGDQSFGFLVVAMESDLVVDEEQRDLITKIAGDLAYALHGILENEAHAESEHQRKLLTEQLTQAQKMEAVGRLAGGVAHDFNNLLMGIMGHVEFCREQLAPDHPIHVHLNEITSSALRSADLTRQLLAFARRQTVAPKVVDLNDAISGMLKLLCRLLGEDIHLVWMPGLNAGSVKMDPSQIDQILANLCINARDAITGVGKLTVETSSVTIDHAYCKQHAEAAPGEYVMLVVSDNGCGMSREVLEHIFEPFFTTKGVGQGTGLGLATVYGIIKQNNGFINVYSESGQGTTFRLYLPRVAAEQAEPAAQPSEAPHGTETLLLAEDDATIRAVAERLLTHLGYTVLVAAGPEEAITLSESYAGEIHLLLTDVIMPAMSGRDLARKLAGQRPLMKTLYMSGYTANVIAHHGVLEPGIAFLQKPVSRMAMALKIREVLACNRPQPVDQHDPARK